jgi:hypothetical protein
VDDELTGHACPVCHFPGLSEPAWTGNSPSYDICPSCGTEFGYGDFRKDPEERARRHEELRAKWIAAGRPWTSSVDERPADWVG